MGVDNDSQISNEKMRNNPDVRTIFIKPKYLDALQAQNVNQKSNRDFALEILQGSNVICAFGTSIGATDTYWWKKIGEWLKSGNKKLIIFDICGVSDDGVSPLAFLDSETSAEDKKGSIIKQFETFSGIGDGWVRDNAGKVIIELDTKMFDFKLPFKSNLRDD